MHLGSTQQQRVTQMPSHRNQAKLAYLDFSDGPIAACPSRPTSTRTMWPSLCSATDALPASVAAMLPSTPSADCVTFSRSAGMSLASDFGDEINAYVTSNSPLQPAPHFASQPTLQIHVKYAYQSAFRSVCCSVGGRLRNVLTAATSDVWDHLPVKAQFTNKETD